LRWFEYFTGKLNLASRVHLQTGKFMENRIKQLSEKFFNREINELGEREKGVLESVKERGKISRDTNEDFDTAQTFGQKVADKVASFGGSWTFIIIYLVFLAAWMTWNSYVFLNTREEFDPYPYILLNLFLSMTAAIQAPIILMSQNRQSERDRLAAAHDYEVNLKAELEIIGLHEKLDDLRDAKWGELLETQRKQIELLTELLAVAEPRNPNDGKKQST
jgi:uncharacterized membrane protein